MNCWRVRELSKERLDEIYNNVGRSIHDDEHVLLREVDYEWLIEQAKKVQELEKYYISEKRLKELLNGNEDIGELYQFVEDNQKIEDVISMLIKEMGYLAGALDDYNKGFFELEKQNKLYWEFINNIKTASEQPISYDELLGVIQSEYKALEESE